jgi:hypothetical protein
VGLVYTVKKSYWKQGEYHASEAVVHAENMLTSKEQINTSVSICTYSSIVHCAQLLQLYEIHFEASYVSLCFTYKDFAAIAD